MEIVTRCRPFQWPPRPPWYQSLDPCPQVWPPACRRPTSNTPQHPCNQATSCITTLSTFLWCQVSSRSTLVRYRRCSLRYQCTQALTKWWQPLCPTLTDICSNGLVCVLLQILTRSGSPLPFQLNRSIVFQMTEAQLLDQISTPLHPRALVCLI